MILVHRSSGKQNLEQQKRTRFDTFLHVGRWRVFFAIPRPATTFFRAHFKSDLDAFWVIFAWFFGPGRSLPPSLRMLLGARQNAWFPSLFEAFLTSQKSSPGQRFVDFLEKKNKTFSRKIIKFWGICRPGECFLIFSRDLVKTVLRETLCDRPEYKLGIQGTPQNA